MNKSKSNHKIIMDFTKQQLAYIIYNNRSVEGVVRNFIPKNLNPFKLQKLEQRLSESKLKYNSDPKNVKIEVDKLNINCDDIIIKPEDLENLTDVFREASGRFCENECKYLQMRGVNWNSVINWGLFGLSQITDEKTLQIVGGSIHPVLSKVLTNHNMGDGIVFPLYQSGKLVNCAIRRLGIENDGRQKSLKYTLAVPDIHVWGLCNTKRIWITEGIFDSMALSSRGFKSISVSSAAWSSIQLLQVIELAPEQIDIFSDNDIVGLRNSAILKDIFAKYGIGVKVFISEFAKDASEHIFSKSISLSQIKEVDVENIDFDQYQNDFDILDYLKNRNF